MLLIILMSLAIALFAWRIFMIGRIFSHLIHEQTHELDRALIYFAATQEQLVHSQTLPSLGQLSAGISHELPPLEATGSSVRLIENEILSAAIEFKGHQLSQVWPNLLSNALDAIENHGGSIRAEKDEGRTCMHVILPQAESSALIL